MVETITLEEDKFKCEKFFKIMDEIVEINKYLKSIKGKDLEYTETMFNKMKYRLISKAEDITYHHNYERAIEEYTGLRSEKLDIMDQKIFDVVELQIKEKEEEMLKTKVLKRSNNDE